MRNLNALAQSRLVTHFLICPCGVLAIGMTDRDEYSSVRQDSKEAGKEVEEGRIYSSVSV